MVGRRGGNRCLACPIVVGALLLCVAGCGFGPAEMDAGPVRSTYLDGFEEMPAPVDREQYEYLPENPFQSVAAQPLSTFSVDVDTAGYANVRRMINDGQRPPVDAVRIEELVNYFDYDYPEPSDEHPISVSSEVATCPWEPDHRLVRIGLKARSIDWADRPASNLVFLLDVSGSMSTPRKLPLVKKSIRLLLQTLGEDDRVAVVVYAGAAGLVLESTPCDQVQEILQALEMLQAGGSTAGGAGIQRAYEVAQRGFIEGGINRVILCTDGDFNVGVSDQGALVRIVEQRAKGGIELTVLGFGLGNLQDSTLEKLADHGNGNYGYIDSELEARKILVAEAGGTLMTMAKDVKVQVEFNPEQAVAYRLLGYENRMLESSDFNDDAVDAGEIGAGHVVTALYQVVPVGVQIDLPEVDDLRYQAVAAERDAVVDDELMFVKVRYKRPDSDASTRITLPITDTGGQRPSVDLQFAAGVAAFGMLLRSSEHRGNADWNMVAELAQSGRGADIRGYRTDFLRLVRRARDLPIVGDSEPS